MLRRRPVMRMAARTAVVAGTATAVSGRVARRQQAAAQPAAPEPVYEQPAPVASPQPAGLAPDAMEQLKGLGALHEQGVLTDEEFATAKAKLLDI